MQNLHVHRNCVLLYIEMFSRDLICITSFFPETKAKDQCISQTVLEGNVWQCESKASTYSLVD